MKCMHASETKNQFSFKFEVLSASKVVYQIDYEGVSHLKKP